MKKVIMLCLVALLVVGMSTTALALKPGSLWGTDNGFCKAWVDRYSDSNNGETLGNNPHANLNRPVKGNSPHQRLAYFMQNWVCGQ